MTLKVKMKLKNQINKKKILINIFGAQEEYVKIVIGFLMDLKMHIHINAVKCFKTCANSIVKE